MNEHPAVEAARTPHTPAAVAAREHARSMRETLNEGPEYHWTRVYATLGDGNAADCTCGWFYTPASAIARRAAGR